MTSAAVDNTASDQMILNEISENQTKKKKEKQFGNVTVERTDGERIILPSDMTYKQAREWLEKIEKAEETVVNFHYEVKAYPSDGAYALYRAMSRKFGFAQMMAKENASGDTPPTMVSLRLPDGTMANVPWGRLTFPGLDAKSFLETKYDNSKMLFIIDGQIRRKYQRSVDELCILTEQILKNESIYKGNAIRVDLSFLDGNGAAFAQPEFLNDSVKTIQEEDVLLDDVTKLNYSAVLLRIKKTEECRKKSVQIKHGCLLAGPYGK